MRDKANNVKRPNAITVVCFIVYFGIVITIPFILFLSFTTSCMAEVYVSEEMVFVDQKSDVVNAESYKYYPLINAQPGDIFDVAVELGNAVYRDISVYVVDQVNLNLFRQSMPFRFFGATRIIRDIG